MQAITAEIEALLLPLGARPHWARSCMRAPSSSQSFIPTCPRFGNSPNRAIRAASSAIAFSTFTCSAETAGVDEADTPEQRNGMLRMAAEFLPSRPYSL